MLNIIESGFLIAVFSLAGGLKLMSSPKKAYIGNILAAVGVSIAVIGTFVYLLATKVTPIHLIAVSIPLILGATLGKIMSSKIKMTKVPQLVSLFNALGGGCALLIALIESKYYNIGTVFDGLQLFLITGVITGGIAFSGSIVATIKLSNKFQIKPNKFSSYIKTIILLSIILLPGFYFLQIIPLEFRFVIYFLSVTSILYGYFLVLPIGGADMPVVISLLNSVTGIATASSGFIYGNTAMIAGGIFVGAAGLLLTHLMCKSMNKTFFKVLKGNKINMTGANEKEQVIQEVISSEAALQIFLSKKIAIIPGYGLAVAQAQHLCNQIQGILHGNQAEVHYIIHPVAGRMPGHMNVLLAEADINYEYLKEMDEVKDSMHTYDLALIIGANDVVNPAAENDSSSSIYGMPIIQAYRCKNVIVLKRSMRTGYAGVPNHLFDLKNCKILFGDARSSLEKIAHQLKELTK